MEITVILLTLLCLKEGVISTQLIKPQGPATGCPLSTSHWMQTNQDYVCNNETLDWLVQSMVDKLSRQHDEIDEISREAYGLIDENAELKKQLELYKNARRAFVDIRPRDCQDLLDNGVKKSGVYTIYPLGLEHGVAVRCNQRQDGGGWTVLQRRIDGDVDFARDWDDYKHGFGNLEHEFWIGNEKLHKISLQDDYIIRFYMWTFEGKGYYAEYRNFSIDGEEQLYRIHINDYSGSAGDGMDTHDGMLFTTMDRDNDNSRSGNCAERYGGGGGWWYNRCYKSSLNGEWGAWNGRRSVIWYPLYDDFTPLKEVFVVIRPKFA